MEPFLSETLARLRIWLRPRLQAFLQACLRACQRGYQRVWPPRGAEAPERLVQLGDTAIVTRGLPSNAGGDLHHRAMTASWPRFFLAFALGFIALNLTFAGLYCLGTDPIANATPGSFLDYFFFSVETIATVGYGDMHPRTIYGHLLATLATIAGITYLAVTTGLIFARFSQPRARLLFANRPVVVEAGSVRLLKIRFANARQNAVAEASAKLWLVAAERDATGVMFRRIRRLALAQDENPLFALSWTIMHEIDAASPLYGWTAEDFATRDATLVITFNGYDETSSIAVHGRHSYSGAQTALDHDYVDIMSRSDGVTRIDYTRFHDIVSRPPSGGGEHPAAAEGVQSLRKI